MYICMCEYVSVCMSLYFFDTTVWLNKMNILLGRPTTICRKALIFPRASRHCYSAVSNLVIHQ